MKAGHACQDRLDRALRRVPYAIAPEQRLAASAGLPWLWPHRSAGDG